MWDRGTPPAMSTYRRLLAVSLFCALTLPTNGCSQVRTLRLRAAADFDCGESEIEVQKIYDNTWKAQGCGRSATYLLIGNPGSRVWAMDSASSERPRPMYHHVYAPPPPKRSVQTRSTASGTWLQAQFRPRSGADILIELQSVPQENPDEVLVKLHQRGGASIEECEVRLVVNGQLLASVPKPVYAKKAGRQELVLRMPLQPIAAMAGASRVVGQVCNTRFEFLDQDIALVRDFLVHFQEELALMGKPPTRQPPNGGDAI